MMIVWRMEFSSWVNLVWHDGQCWGASGEVVELEQNTHAGHKERVGRVTWVPERLSRQMLLGGGGRGEEVSM